MAEKWEPKSRWNLVYDRFSAMYFRVDNFIDKGCQVVDAASYDALRAEVERLTKIAEELRKGEFICTKCGLRKDADFVRGDF